MNLKPRIQLKNLSLRGLLVSAIAIFSIAFSSLGLAKDRYLVQFKSAQGYEAMKSYYSRLESNTAGVQNSLDNVHAIVFKTKNVDC